MSKLFKRISNFFIPGMDSGDFELDQMINEEQAERAIPEKEENPYEVLLTANQNLELLELARKNNFYNYHPHLALQFHQEKNHDQARQVLLELLLGPLNELLWRSIEDYNDEPLYLNRALYLLQYHDNEFGDASIALPETYSQLMNHWRRNEAFAGYLDRFHANLSQTSVQSREQAVDRAIGKNLVLVLEKIADLDQEELTIEPEVYNSFQSHDVFLANQWSEIKDRLKNAQPATDGNSRVFAVAHSNLENFLTTGSPKQYRQNQAKLDLLEVALQLSGDGLYSLARKLKIYDAYPLAARKLCQAGEYNQACEILSECLLDSRIFHSETDFKNEMLKDALVRFLSATVTQLHDEDKEMEYKIKLSKILPKHYQLILNGQKSDHESWQSHADQAVSTLTATTKNIL